MKRKLYSIRSEPEGNKDCPPVFVKNREKGSSSKKVAKALKCYQIASSTEKIIAPKNYAADSQRELLEIWQSDPDRIEAGVFVL